MKIRYIGDPLGTGRHICFSLNEKGWFMDPSVYASYTLEEVCVFRIAAMGKNPDVEMILIYNNRHVQFDLPVAIITKS